ncbi:hypothetical protein ONZ45_g4401 [Pleurotus djamor]|nr:hypothetical protein ONZ45_g4401 [Pleurotus djamor]
MSTVCTPESTARLVLPAEWMTFVQAQSPNGEVPDKRLETMFFTSLAPLMQAVIIETAKMRDMQSKWRRLQVRSLTNQSARRKLNHCAKTDLRQNMDQEAISRQKVILAVDLDPDLWREFKEAHETSDLPLKDLKQAFFDSLSAREQENYYQMAYCWVSALEFRKREAEWRAYEDRCIRERYKKHQLAKSKVF